MEWRESIQASDMHFSSENIESNQTVEYFHICVYWKSQKVEIETFKMKS